MMQTDGITNRFCSLLLFILYNISIFAKLLGNPGKSILLSNSWISIKRYTPIINDGPKEREAIRDHLDVTIQVLVSEMKKLEGNYPVIRVEDTYMLTSVGKAVVTEIIPVLNMIHFFENIIDYWGTHNFDSIHPPLLQRIRVGIMQFHSSSITYYIR